MEDILYFQSSADRTKTEKIQKMTKKELLQYLPVLEEEESLLERHMEISSIQERTLEGEINMMIEKISLDKSKDMVKNLENIIVRYNLAKENTKTSYNSSFDRGVTFKSVVCNKVYDKICKYNSYKINSTNQARVFLNQTKDAITRVKQRICKFENTNKPVKTSDSEEDDWVEETKQTIKIVYEPVDEDW